MAYDIEDDAIVIFGGYTYWDSMDQGDTWVYWRSTGEWECMNPTISPTPRRGSKMVYDAANDRMVLFGGYSALPWKYYDETWTYDLDRNRWSLVETPVAPEARYSHSMVYDSHNGRTILFGGQRQDNPYRLNDTWTFETESGTWTHIQTDIAPSPRHGTMSCFDDVNGVMVLFGGYIDVSPYREDDTWELNVSSMTWTEKSPTTSPSERYSGMMANLPGTGRSLLFGGRTSSSPYYPTAVWWYNSSTTTWTRVVEFGPAGRTEGGIIYSMASGQFILFGGSGYSTRPDLWGFDPSTEEWEYMAPQAPLPRQHFGFVYDEVNDRFILFGGYDYDGFNDTWSYDARSKEWTLIDYASAPEARYEFGMTYDSNNEVVVLFGGRTRETYYLGDTWEFDVSTDTWTRTSTSGPVARYRHAMAYDQTGDRTILFGGSSSGTTYRTDTMEYDASANSWYSGGTGPAGRYHHAMAYLGSTGTIVMFGGYGSSGRLSDTQEYTTSTDTWSSKTTSTVPYKRYGHAMAYDPLNDRVYMFGGRETFELNETYYYYSSGSNRYWYNVNTGTHPDGRSQSEMAFDSKGICVLFGGYTSHHMDDVWHISSGAYHWKLDIPPTRLRSYQTDLMYDHVNQQFLKFGNGASYSNQIWQISPDDGSLSILARQYSGGPIPLKEAHCAIGPMTGELLVFGGSYRGTASYRYINRTWLCTLEGVSWDEVSEDVGSRNLRYTSIEYDRDQNKGVLFGGYYYDSGTYILNDTWLFDPYTETWSQANPTDSPSKRYGNVMAYDSVNRRIMIHGGYLESGSNRVSGETWAYDLENDNWIQLSDGPALYHHMASFDTTRGRLLVWGGISPSAVSGDIWEYDAAEDEWRELDMTQMPSRRYFTDMAYDPNEDIFLMHGGYYYDGMDTYLMSDIWRIVPDANEKNGIYTSAPIGPECDTALWESVSWTLEGDDHTSVLVQIATDDDGVNGTFVGPDGTPDTYFTVSSGESIDPGTISQFLRYRLYLETDHAGRTPDVTSFTVTYRPIEFADIELHSPNGGEDLIESGSHIITWSTTGDVDSVDIHYSTDGGSSWAEITSDASDTGYHNWSVPSIETATGLIRITANGMDGSTAMDASDMTFAIDPPANWQLPGTGNGDGTGDGGDGETTGSPDQTPTEDTAETGTLWIVVTGEAVAITLLTIVLAVMFIRRREGA
jgi:hypothetical protein